MLSVAAWEESGIMVLLEKQVHLQKEGGAKRSLACYAQRPVSPKEMLWNAYLLPIPKE